MTTASKMRDILEGHPIFLVLGIVVSSILVTSGVVWGVVYNLIITPKNEEIQRLREKSPETQKRTNQEPQSGAPIVGINDPNNETEALRAMKDALLKEIDQLKIEKDTLSNEIEKAQAQLGQKRAPSTGTTPGLTREIDGVKVYITDSRLVGDTIQFDFRLVNETSEDQILSLFAHEGSKIYAEEKEYRATSIVIGEERSTRYVEKTLPPRIPLSGRLSFTGMPSHLRRIDALQIGYSHQNSVAQGAVRFPNISLK